MVPLENAGRFPIPNGAVCASIVHQPAAIAGGDARGSSSCYLPSIKCYLLLDASPSIELHAKLPEEALTP